MSSLKFNLSKITKKSILQSIEKNSNDTLSYKLSFRFFVYEHSRIIRKVILFLLKKYLSKIDINKINLVIDELINNAIEHSNNKLNIIKLKINTKKNSTIIAVKIKVLDAGNKNKIKAKKILNKENDLDNKKNLHKLRGRGLFCIVKRISNHFNIKDNKNGGINVISKVEFLNIKKNT